LGERRRRRRRRRRKGVLIKDPRRHAILTGPRLTLTARLVGGGLLR
jgi:hypothetical protein